ncbi:hypothetical protein, partial [Streptomyces rhizosphaericola]|uniref:hypothetical protein n=1 Tax=Streptomyces rhizosphaericola TaxID=2564098 RepID=UPI0019CF71A7
MAGRTLPGRTLPGPGAGWAWWPGGEGPLESARFDHAVLVPGPAMPSARPRPPAHRPARSTSAT